MGKGEKIKGSLGAEFKKIRTHKRISLDKIGAKLRINVKFLKSMEDNNFDFLHRPYVLAFVKAYANELGLNIDDVKEKFDQQLRSQFENSSFDKQEKFLDKTIIAQSSANLTSAKPIQNIEFSDFLKHNKKTLVVVTVFTLFVIIIFLLQKLYFGPQDTILNTPQAEQTPETNPRSVVSDTSTRAVTTNNEPIELRLVTNESLWIRMSVDNGVPQEFTFDQNETRTWTAQDRFELRMGKSVGYDLIFNDSLLQNLGNENTMIGNLVLTKDGIGDLRLLQQPPDTTFRR